MKVAYITTYDASDVAHWSGSGLFIARALERAGLELEFIGSLSTDPLTHLLLRMKGLYYNRLSNRRYFRSHDAVLARRYARVVDRELARRPEVDLLFSPGVVPVAFLEDQRPLAMWSDATHACIFDYYAEYSGLCDETRRDGHLMERTALNRAAAAIFTSDWAAESARADYGTPDARVHMIPFGANVERPPSDEDVEIFLAARPTDRCKLLFIGVDWERKGGPLAVEVTRLLNASGLPTELTIAGCDPYGEETPPPFVTVEGFLNKSKTSARQRFRTLLSEHHLLILPSIAECYGLVYCEANCFGVPCLARRTGGVPTIIKDGDNGHLFDVSADAGPYAHVVGETFRDYGRYRAMARRARRQFTGRLNWGVAGERAAGVLGACVATNAPKP